MASYYGTVAEADLYFADKLHESNWSGSLASDKPKALIAASRLIDALTFCGDKTDESQELEFPRDDETVVPEKIKWACYEIAYELLGGFDAQLEADSRLVASETYASVKITYFNPNTTTTTVQPHTEAGIPSKLAYQWLTQFQCAGETGDYFTMRVDRAS